MSCAERRRGARPFPLETRAARTPDAPALVWREDGGGAPTTVESMSFRDLERWSADISLALRHRGLEDGARVGLRLQPGPRYPALLLALWRAGLVAVPLSTRLPAAALPELVRRIDCRWLVVDTDVAAETPAGIETIAVEELPGASQQAGGECGRNLLPSFDGGAPATIVFTSGSMGPPKAALHTFASHWASAVGANRNLPLRPGSRWLLSLPLWHVGGMAVVLRCLQAGAAVLLPGREAPLAGAILDLGATHVSLVATQLHRLLRSPEGREALRRPKAVLLGGGPLPFPLIEEAARLGVRMVASYGSTEMASQVTATRPGEPLERLRTAGKPLAFREVAVDADGEILVRGRTLFSGYLEEGVLRDRRDPAGWFHTGDLGRIDSDGCLVVAGRRDTMFISGGENIHPEEIERELLRFPGVLEAIVVPVPDEEFGARPAACLRTGDGSLPDPAEIRSFLRAALPGFKVPVRYLSWPDLADGMKPDRKTFVALARATGQRG